MYASFIPLLSRLSRDSESAWSLWRFLSDFSDALWEMHQDDFLQRFSDELQDDPWLAPDDPDPDNQADVSNAPGCEEPSILRDPSQTDLW